MLHQLPRKGVFELRDISSRSFDLSERAHLSIGLRTCQFGDFPRGRNVEVNRLEEDGDGRRYHSKQREWHGE